MTMMNFIEPLFEKSYAHTYVILQKMCDNINIGHPIDGIHVPALCTKINDIDFYDLQVQQNLGYCPQFDALIDQMTGRETLTMYARLRGIKENQIKGVVNDLLEIMMLRKYADRQCGTYR